MQIILQEDIEKLGHRGDVVTVKPGYARNFLLPRKLAIEATAGNMKASRRIRASLAKKTATELDAAQKQAAALNGVELQLHAQDRRERSALRLRHHRRHRRSPRSQGLQDRQAPDPAPPNPSRPSANFRVTVKVFRDITAEVKVQVAKEE